MTAIALNPIVSSTQQSWVFQLLLILIIFYVSLKIIVDAKDKRYEDRIKQRDETINKLTTEKDVQLTGMARQIEALQYEVNQLRIKLDKEFERRHEAEQKIMELETARQSNDRDYILVLTENRNLRIELEGVNPHGGKRE